MEKINHIMPYMPIASFIFLRQIPIMQTLDLSDDEIIEKITKKELQMYKLEEYLGPNKAVEIRRQIVEKATNSNLADLSIEDADYSQMVNKNAENVIGFIRMPIGISGPITIHGDYASGEFYVPLATTEGALIAGINRGMKAISESNGSKVKILGNAMARAPLFEFDSITEVGEFLNWLDLNMDNVKKIANATTSHGKLRDVKPFVTGNNVWLRMSFETGDAMGMNMATVASEAASSYIEEEFPKAHLVTVSGNMCSDKKESMVNNLLGRGKTVVADAVINRKVCSEVLKTTPEQITRVNMKKNMLGNARAGSTKFSGHSANIVAAAFAATGQDIAQVVESSSCYTWAEARESGLYISVTLPSLEVGTVGGGTSLPSQKAALSIIGAAGQGETIGTNANKLAEIIAAAVLAGELNLLAAQGNRELGKAHSKLGRNIK